MICLFSLQFQFVTENGGNVKVRNKESFALNTYYYTGNSEQTTVRMGIDYVVPYHCHEYAPCLSTTMTVIAVSLEVSVYLD